MESERNSETKLVVEEEEEERNEILKRRISSHPLYGLLLDAHMECLKVGDMAINMDNEQKIAQKEATKKHNLGMLNQNELDLFMEAYCLALGKLKEAMEEPQQRSMAFINSMHSQLRELTIEHAAATSSDDSKNQDDSSI
ncbi:hypothetical protein L6164_006372 [Bauhinia variegata]|uniref:Uncharacterized protein n=1 Tax=Bauhinia variegata TaxID=167791 RepID=A0ACB9PUB6_BAUVA|nr:hypothetical protein L6164_006372 [Bauhinia variegata]